MVRHSLYKPNWRRIEKFAAIDTRMRLLIDNVVLEDMNQFVVNYLAKRFKGSGKRYNDAVFKEFCEPAYAFVKFLEDYVGFLEILVGFVKNEGCSVLQLMLEILAVLLISLFSDGSHNGYKFRFAWVVVDVKMLCPVDVPIEALSRDFIFTETKTLRPPNTRCE